MKRWLTLGTAVLGTVLLTFAYPQLAYSFANGVKSYGLAPIHEEITREALSHSSIPVTLTSGETKFFYDGAVNEIIKANVDLDLPYFYKDFQHVDNETIFEASAWIAAIRQRVLSAIQRKDWPYARAALGQGLHTLQDFYAHTNWIYLHPGAVEGKLGQAGYGVGLPVAADTCDFDSKPYLLPYLTSGYFTVTDPLNDDFYSALQNDTYPYHYLRKCRHGSFGVGVNKDGPTRPGYKEARHLATLATQEYV